MEPVVLDSLDGQVALVSGANRGIGAVIALRLAELGAIVFAGARDPKKLGNIEEESGGAIRPSILDVSDEASIRTCLEDMREEVPRLDILVNNAGIGDWHGQALHTESSAVMDAVLDTNLRGPMILCREALPDLLARPGGRVVNVSSGMGSLAGDAGGTAPSYRISKAGLNGLTMYLHGEYAPRGLIANSACPGWVRTAMGGPGAPRSPHEGADTPVWLCRFGPGSPGGLFWRNREVIPW